MFTALDGETWETGETGETGKTVKASSFKLLINAKVWKKKKKNKDRYMERQASLALKNNGI